MDDAIIDDAPAPAVRRDLTTVEVDGELVIFDALTSEIHQLDRLGALIWPFLDGEGTLGELVLDLAAAFEAPVEQVRGDVLSLLTVLTEHRLIDGLQPDVDADARVRELDGPTYLVDPPAP